MYLHVQSINHVLHDLVFKFQILSVISGHMDGCLHVVGVDGQHRHTLPAHTKPVSILRSAGGRVVSGGYDGMVAVHRLRDLEREAAVTIHSGSNVTALALDSVSYLVGIEGEVEVMPVKDDVIKRCPLTVANKLNH